MCADVDEIIPFKRREWSKLTKFHELWRFLMSLRKREWDYVIDVQGLFRSGLCTWFAANGTNSFGFAEARELASHFYKHKIFVRPEHVHAVDKNIHLLNEALQMDEGYVAPRFREDEAASVAADRLIDKHGLGDKPLLAVAIASRWPSKNWPPTFFAHTVDLIAEQAGDLGIWLLGAPAEQDIGQQVMAHCKSGKLCSLIGETDLSSMIELLKRTKVLLTNDSGPMHIAAALETPTVSLFGPTSPEKTGPYGPIHRVFRSELDCSPCYKRDCPLEKQLCYSDVISPEKVAAEICKIIAES